MTRKKLKASEKRTFLRLAGCEPPDAHGCPGYETHWFIPRDLIPELGDSAIDRATTGKMVPFTEAWQRYIAVKGDPEKE